MKSPAIKTIKAWSCFIHWKEEENEVSGEGVKYWSGEGFYWGKTRCVKIYGFGPYKKRLKYTIRIELRIDGVEFERTYNKKFSVRGLQLICARLIRDSEKLYKKTKGKL